LKLPLNYYPCFLGNGLDAVLIGYTGSMVADKVGVDRCAWYKSDRYYPEDRLVKVAGRFPMDKPLEHAEGSGWFEIAPLGHTWYEVVYQGQPLEVQTSTQHFEPFQGLLRSELDFGPVKAQATTFLHARESLLVERYEFNTEVEFRAWMAPGVWVEEGWDTDPFHAVRMAQDAQTGWYDLGETHGNFFLAVEPAAGRTLVKDNARGMQAHGRVITKYFSILDDRQGHLDPAQFQTIISPGYEALLAGHLQFWQAYSSRSQLEIPDAQFQSFYNASLYHFKAAQNRLSGGLPVNNLRRTWSSHVFWDSYYLQRALLEANHLDESREACRFFQRTLDAARRHAREEFGRPGLKWDWEITHDGRKAYGTLLHMKFQAHNNGSYSNELWQHYLFTGDLSYLAEVYPILEGLATFFMEGIIERTERGWEVGALVGVNESPVKVRNEGMNLAATIVILEHCVEAAHLLGRETDFTQRCREVAAGLHKTVDLLFNGKYFVSAEGAENINTASTGVIYPMQVIPFNDRRARLTSQVILNDDSRRHRDGHDYNFPWSWGVLGMILACQGRADDAWKAIQYTRPTICQFGGMTEVMEDGLWNMQYFCTAQAAVTTAIHNLLLQSNSDEIRVFPAVPSDWQNCSFLRLLGDGLEVSASYDRGHISGEVRNITPNILERTVKVGTAMKSILLKPGETCAIETP
jgi:hypothetical protein